MEPTRLAPPASRDLGRLEIKWGGNSTIAKEIICLQSILSYGTFAVLKSSSFDPSRGLVGSTDFRATRNNPLPC